MSGTGKLWEQNLSNCLEKQENKLAASFLLLKLPTLKHAWCPSEFEGQKSHEVCRWTCLHVQKPGELALASRGCRPNNRDTASTVGLLWVERGGEGLGTLLGSWLKKGEGREDTECESQCDWFQIEKQGEGLLLCPAASPGCWRGAPQVRSRIRQWGLCRRNGCDYRPGGGFLPPLGAAAAVGRACVQMKGPLLW